MGNYTRATRKLSSKIATAQLRFTLGLWLRAKQQPTKYTKPVQIQRKPGAEFGYHLNPMYKDYSSVSWRRRKRQPILK